MTRLLLVSLALIALSACSHYWERPGAGVADFERESAVCVEEAKKMPPTGSAMEQTYRNCMRSTGWRRVEVPVADTNQFRGPEDTGDFFRPPAPLSGSRYR